MTVREEYGEGIVINGVYMELDGHADPSGQLFSKNSNGYSDFVIKVTGLRVLIVCW